jgi:hypothetical protein
MTHETPPFSADAALRHFRSYFTEPKDVVAHPQLSRDEKLAILREWEQEPSACLRPSQKVWAAEKRACLDEWKSP